MRIAVITKNIYLYQKIRLALPEGSQAELIEKLSQAAGFDLCLADMTSDSKQEDIPEIRAESEQLSTKIITMGQGADLQIPFTFDSLYALLEGADNSTPELTLGIRCAYLRGEKIPLTEVEYALLKILYDARGDYVSREELKLKVWDDSTDSGVVNVYVYYLRQKLERGEKIINTSRKLGYKIDKKYIGGDLS